MPCPSCRGTRRPTSEARAHHFLIDRDGVEQVTRISGWLLWAVLAFAQGLSALHYDLGVALGFQRSAAMITEVGRAWWQGFAVADLLIYVTLMGIGLLGHHQRKAWGRFALAAAARISLYWPVVFGAAMVLSREAAGWRIDSELPIWAFGAVYFIWGLLAAYCLIREERRS